MDEEILDKEIKRLEERLGEKLTEERISKDCVSYLTIGVTI